MKYPPPPIDMLPSDIRGSIETVAKKHQISIRASMMGALTAISFATQGLADGNLGKGPTSLGAFYLGLGESGSGKTTSDREHLRSIREFQDKLMQQEENEFSAGIILENVTEAALIKSMHDFTSVAILSDEGGYILTGSNSKITQFNKIFSGHEAIRTTSKKGRLSTKNSRLTLSLMTQPAVLREIISKDRIGSLETGLLARFQAMRIDSTLGYRSSPVENLESKSVYQPSIQRRISELLEQTAWKKTQLTSSPRQCITIGEAGRKLMKDFHKDFEPRLRPDGDLHHISAFAARQEEKILQMATRLHVFCGRPGEIDDDHIECGIAFSNFYLAEFLAIMQDFDGPQNSLQAEKLEAWLVARTAPRGWIISLKEIYHYAPYALRKKAALDLAIAALLDQGKIEKIKIQGKLHINARNLAPKTKFEQYTEGAVVPPTSHGLFRLQPSG